ncbi:MAG TPA: alpha/beta fold hydrolase [Steroidobacteraceae bacterium]|nr:alpha/beta fold hydrolase [Steroidobacteraceae bacterium]
MGEPPGLTSHEEFIETGGGHRMSVRSWRPAGEPRAVLAAVPGTHSQRGYYERLATTLAESGIATVAWDRRGRGRSPWHNWFAAPAAAAVDDVGALVSFALQHHPARPLFLLGQGDGGVIATAYTLDAPHAPAGLICESLTLETPASAVAARVVAAVASIAPRLPMSRRHRARATLRACLADFSLPLLLLHGSADRIALPCGSGFFHEVAVSRDKTLQIFESYHHGLLNDRRHEQVEARIRDWILARLDPAGDRESIGISFINDGS